jgi:hypothetical protein
LAEPRQRRNVSALATTLTLRNAIAAPAITGLSRPKAASGMPRQADVGGHQRRCVVQPVADHGDHLALGAQLLHDGRLVARQQFGAHLHGLPAGTVVARAEPELHQGGQRGLHTAVGHPRRRC